MDCHAKYTYIPPVPLCSTTSASALARKSNNNYHSTRLGSLLFPEKCMFADYKPLQEKQHLHTLQVPGILVCFVVPLNIHE